MAVIWSFSGTLHASLQSTKHLQARVSATTRRLPENHMLLMTAEVAQSMVLNTLPFLDTPVTTLQRCYTLAHNKMDARAQMTCQRRKISCPFRRE